MPGGALVGTTRGEQVGGAPTPGEVVDSGRSFSLAVSWPRSTPKRRESRTPIGSAGEAR
ncbi:MAG: hypothetical protein ACRCXL_07140 [Dermatophilaceae bacterium]